MTGADVGSLISATHDVPDSVANENGPGLSILKLGVWTGFEIAHLFLRVNFFLLQQQKMQNPIETRRKAEEQDTPRRKDLVL